MSVNASTNLPYTTLQDATRQTVARGARTARHGSANGWPAARHVTTAGVPVQPSVALLLAASHLGYTVADA
jgi:hypothetical protein